MIKDVIKIIENQESHMNYNEDVIMQDVLQYIASTYREHYVTKNENTEEILQTFDVMESMKILYPFAQGSAIKYLQRYGKKNGNNTKDLYKAIHYIVIMLYNEIKYNKENLK